MIVIALASSLTSCRKGDNDPFISLRSRNSRLIGEWDLVDISGTRIETTAPAVGSTKTRTIVTTYEDGVKKTLDDVTNKDSVFEEKLIISDDGTYTDTVKSKKVGKANWTSVRIITNSWSWTDAKKKKSGILLVGMGSFEMDRLSSNDLTLVSYKKNTSQTASSSYTVEESVTCKFDKNE